MKVLHLGKFYPPSRGGMETILQLICDRTSAAVRNTVLVANDNFTLKQECHGDVQVIRLPAIAKIGAVALCPTLPFRLAAEPADLIVIHEPNPMALLAYFLARPPGAVIVWFHSEVVRGFSSSAASPFSPVAYAQHNRALRSHSFTRCACGGWIKLLAD